MKEPVKTGIMGGTFNPIHMGHLMIGECAFEQFGLDQVMFMPSKIPPHKKQALLASEDDRRNMVELAIEDNPDFVLSTMELEREGTTYSVDTLKELTAQNRNRKYYFILGADSLFDLPMWKEPEKLLSMATILVASRHGMEEARLLEQIEWLKQKYGGEFFIVTVPTIDISSSQIRDKIEKQESIRYYVTDGVRNYIEEKGLYQKNREGDRCGQPAD